PGHELRGRVPGARGRRGGGGPAEQANERVIGNTVQSITTVEAVADVGLDVRGFIASELAGAEQAQAVRAGGQGRGRVHGRSPGAVRGPMNRCKIAADSFTREVRPDAL